MKKRLTSEKILLEELSHEGKEIKKHSKNLSIGELLKLIRLQLGMSQKVLSKRARVPQPTISRIERGSSDCNLSTLQKLSAALSCDLIITPVLKAPIDTLRHAQAKQIARKRIKYTQGTMGLEMQEPDERFLHELINEEIIHLLHSSSSKLWEG